MIARRTSRTIGMLLSGLLVSPVLGQMAGMLNFQGFIRGNTGPPVNGMVDLEFRINDAETLGNLIDVDGDGMVEDLCGEDVTCTSPTAVDGNVSAKWGPVHPSAFDGTERWLEVSIDGSPLSRIEMVTAPAASEQVNIPASGTPAINVDAAGNVGIPGTLQAGSSIIINGTADTITSNGDLELHINSGRALRLETNGTSPNIIGGHSGNSVGAIVVRGTVAGGGFGLVGLPNSVTADFATVSGGIANTASGQDSTVGGAGLTPPAAVIPPSAAASTTTPAANLLPSAGASTTTPPRPTPPSAGAIPTPPAGFHPPSQEG